jgi:hypothetical protein
LIYITIYLAGVVVALAVMRDAWPARVGTALVWPLGPLAFVVVVTILLLASVLLWPLLLLPLAALVALAGWWLA